MIFPHPIPMRHFSVARGTVSSYLVGHSPLPPPPCMWRFEDPKPKWVAEWDCNGAGAEVGVRGWRAHRKKTPPNINFTAPLHSALVCLFLP